MVLERILNSCYLYEYTGGHCDYCPLDKPQNKRCLDGLYMRWCFCKSYEEAADLADQIAELPEVNFNGAELNCKKGE